MGKRNNKVSEVPDSNNLSGPIASVDSAQENHNNVIQFRKPSCNTFSLVPEFAVTIKEAKKRIELLKKFVDEMMIPGVDYGIVSNVNKPTLLKPGAEKLCDAYGFSKRVEVTNRLEDWYHGVFHYEVKVTLICKYSGLIEAEGVASCNSRETAYREYAGHDVANTILKMAKKRALIDAVLSATRSSDIFTQDIEEMDWMLNKGSKVAENQNLMVTRNQLALIFSIVEQKKIPVDKVKEIMGDRYKISESKKLTRYQASDFIDYLKSFQNQEK